MLSLSPYDEDVSTGETQKQKHFVIISDLHLGHTLRSHGHTDGHTKVSFRQLRMVATLDAAIESFLEDISQRLGDEIEQTVLVLNGDIFDFLHVDLRPETGTFERPPLDGSLEREYGLSFELSRSRWKLNIIAQVHRRAFSAFANFIARGGRLVFIGES